MSDEFHFWCFCVKVGWERTLCVEQKRRGEKLNVWRRGRERSSAPILHLFFLPISVCLVAAPSSRYLPVILQLRVLHESSPIHTPSLFRPSLNHTLTSNPSLLPSPSSLPPSPLIPSLSLPFSPPFLSSPLLASPHITPRITLFSLSSPLSSPSPPVEYIPEFETAQSIHCRLL